MKPKMLLANKFKKIGWFLLIPATLMGLLPILFNFQEIEINATVFAIYSGEIFNKGQNASFIKTDIYNTLVGVFFIVGGLLVGFSKEKNEDEYISNLRLNSLLWAVFVNYIFLLFMFIFIYGIAFLNVMAYNMFTILILFIAKFNYSLFLNSKLGLNEE
ncbi:MAG: hypothetical protein JST52_01775 [Bacteroidetes bacterium]|nr:hypothetical protein [Bacteroidota bacterium]MBS1741321.1 hypothetical protein [Bacteroidota bacterium]MBS1776368.1 hypothetical protein [Bacteroidota bacterium]